MSKIQEHNKEPVPGLPQELPDGERMLWQGRPTVDGLAAGTFHIRKIAVYFALLLAYTVVSRAGDGQTIGMAIGNSINLAILAVVAVGMLAGYARLVAKSTMFTITTRRIVVRTGVALPVTINLPFSRIESADLRARADDNGEIAVRAERGSRPSYILLWPFVRPFRFIRVQPVLRGIDEASEAASLLAEAMEAAAAVPAPVTAGERLPHRNTPAPAKESWEDRRRRWLSYPTLPLAAATSLVVISLITVGIARLVGTETTDAPNAVVVASVDLHFEDRDDGSVVVIDADSDRVLDVLEPGTNGFIRGTLRSLARARRAVDAGSEQPFTLTQIDTGRLVLSDTVSGREIDLWAFGRTNAAAFTRYLDPGVSDAVTSFNEPLRDGVATETTAVTMTTRDTGR